MEKYFKVTFSKSYFIKSNDESTAYDEAEQLFLDDVPYLPNSDYFAEITEELTEEEIKQLNLNQ